MTEPERDLWSCIDDLAWSQALLDWRGDEDKPMYRAELRRAPASDQSGHDPFVIVLAVSDSEAERIAGAIHAVGVEPALEPAPAGQWYELRFECPDGHVHIDLSGEAQALQLLEAMGTALSDVHRSALRPLRDRYAGMVGHDPVEGER